MTDNGDRARHRPPVLDPSQCRFPRMVGDRTDYCVLDLAHGGDHRFVDVTHITWPDNSEEE